MSQPPPSPARSWSSPIHWGLSAVVAAILIAVCAWRTATNRPYDYSTQLASARLMRPALPLVGLTAQQTLFRLESYLHRHEILLVFRVEMGTADEPAWQRLLSGSQRLIDRGVKVVGICPLLPQQLRQRSADDLGEFPWVCDTDGQLFRLWGCWDERQQRAKPGLIWIDRAGNIQVHGTAPVAIPDEAQFFQEVDKS
jgi:peroxiredoxin